MHVEKLHERSEVLMQLPKLPSFRYIYINVRMKYFNVQQRF